MLDISKNSFLIPAALVVATSVSALAYAFGDSAKNWACDAMHDKGIPTDCVSPNNPKALTKAAVQIDTSEGLSVYVEPTPKQ